MHLNFAPHRSKWHFVVVKGSIQVGVGGDRGCGVGLSEQVDGDLSLWK